MLAGSAAATELERVSPSNVRGYNIAIATASTGVVVDNLLLRGLLMMQVGSLVVDSYGAEWRFLNLQLSRPKLKSLPQDAQHNSFLFMVLICLLSSSSSSSYQIGFTLPGPVRLGCPIIPRYGYPVRRGFPTPLD